MSVSERVVAFLRGGRPGAYCDDCIKDGLQLARRQDVAIVTLTLAQCSGFGCDTGTCASRNHKGSRQKLVTRAL